MKHPKQFDTDPTTSKRMSNVKLKHGEAESILSKALWHRGLRYQLNSKKLPGSPDIAILKYKLAVFVDGEFWHGYEWEKRKPKLKRNRDYWIAKIEENISRDKRVDAQLIELGWVPIHFWSKDVIKCVDDCILHIEEYIQNLDP
ncbi:MAG: very short patch repair endonuclease [Clostridia bacterium]|nr:very short patch repair endonuclease [Clostridia bacterium]